MVPLWGCAMPPVSPTCPTLSVARFLFQRASGSHAPRARMSQAVPTPKSRSSGMRRRWASRNPESEPDA
eukprot:15473646-Alexandrium_andersonii.AAC.1